MGEQWCLLADFYIRQGLFEKARDIYEEGIQSVQTVRDFTQIFDAFAAFEEELISNSMGDGIDEDEMEMQLARFEDLLERRPFLVNSVLLRQNPHNVHEWMKDKVMKSFQLKSVQRLEKRWRNGKNLLVL